MTGPGRPDAELTAKLTVDTSEVDDDVGDALDRTAKKNDPKLKRLGKDMGEATSKAMGEEMERRAPDLADALSAGLRGSKVRVTKETFQLDGENNVVKRWVTVLSDGLDKEVRRSGAFGAVGGTISQAIGAGFNVSGRSGLIILLIPLIGLIAELIAILIHGVGALVALLYIVPSIVGAIILQVGVLFLAFQGVGTAIQGAFEAKNAYELQQAIKDLTPAAQDFVKSLLPLRDIFNRFQDAAQQGFFQGFAGSISELIEAVNRIGIGPIQTLATALGQVAGTVVKFLDAPSFQRFIQELIPATVQWLNDFGPSLLDFLTGLANLGTAVMPFLNTFGASFNDMVSGLGYWLTKLAYDPEFIKFLDDAWETIKLLGVAIVASIVFLKDFWQAFKTAGADVLIKQFIWLLQTFSTFFAHPIGQKALEGLIHAIVLLVFLFAGLLAGVLLFFALLEYVFEWIRYEFWPFLQWLFTEGVPVALAWLGEQWVGLFTWVLGALKDLFYFIFVTVIWGFIKWVIGQIFNIVGGIVQWFIDAGRNISNFFSVTLPNLIKTAVAGIGNWLYEAGRSLFDGLLRGIKSMFPNIGGVMSSALSAINRFLPFSPAEEGPLSGKGDPMKSGQRIIQRLAAGIEMAAPELEPASATAISNITFGPGSIQVGFNGALPTTEQAKATGAAAGQGITSQLTRLGIRTL